MSMIRNLFGKKQSKDEIPYNPEKQYPVLRCSICTGEQVAGFKSRNDGHFTEVMLIENKEDEMYFKKKYGIDELKKEY